jgi:hypothetical protein
VLEKDRDRIWIVSSGISDMRFLQYSQEKLVTLTVVFSNLKFIVASIGNEFMLCAFLIQIYCPLGSKTLCRT